MMARVSDDRGGELIRVFIPYDPREGVAFSVLSHSLHRHSSRPFCVTPLVLRQLGDVLSRPKDPLQSTEFAISGRSSRSSTRWRTPRTRTR